MTNIALNDRGLPQASLQSPSSLKHGDPVADALAQLKRSTPSQPELPQQSAPLDSNRQAPSSSSVSPTNRDALADAVKTLRRSTPTDARPSDWPDPLTSNVTLKDENGQKSAEFTDRTGKRVAVTPDSYGELYDEVVRQHALQSDYNGMEYLTTQKSAFDAKLLPDGEQLPHLSKLAFSEQRGDTVMLADNDGKRLLINRSLNPEAFTQAQQMHKDLEGIRASELHGYKNVLNDAYTDEQLAGAVFGPKGEAGPGLLRAEVTVGEGDVRKIVVSKDLNPELYDRLDAARLGVGNGPQAIDDARRAAGIPASGDLDPLALKTGEKADPKAKNSPELTVRELAWREMTKSWQDGVKNGSIASTDPRARLLNLMTGQAAMADGAPMIVGDMAQGQSVAYTTPADIEQIIDRAKLDTETAKLLDDPAVTGDLMKHQDAALAKVDPQVTGKMREDLTNLAKDPAYTKYLIDLQNSGKGDLAQADMGRTFSALAAFDKEAAAKFAQSVAMNGRVAALDGLIADPSKITDANLSQASIDTVKESLGAAKKAGIDIPRRVIETIDKFVNEFLKDGQQAKAFHGVLQELGDVYAKTGAITDADINKVLTSSSKPQFKALNDQSKGTLRQTLAEVNKFGALGSMGGMISLASGVYQVTGTDAKNTPEGRLGIVKDFVSFAGAGAHFATFGTNIIDHYKKTNLNKMMGLDKTLPEIFSTDKPTKNDPAKAQEARFQNAFQIQLEQAAERAQASKAAKDKVTLKLSPEEMSHVYKGMVDGYVEKPALPNATSWTRAASAFLRSFEAAANGFGGAADIALGGLNINKGAKAGEAGTVTSGALQVASGVAGLAGGAAQGAALAGSTIGRAVAGPLLGGAAVLGLVATLPKMIMDDLKHQAAANAHREKMMGVMTDLDQQGVMKEGGLDRYKFLDAYMHGYGQRDAPTDKTIIDYRSGEFDVWRQTGFLDDQHHADFKGDGENLDTALARVG